jgi:hypothetical protein
MEEAMLKRLFKIVDSLIKEVYLSGAKTELSVVDQFLSFGFYGCF